MHFKPMAILITLLLLNGCSMGWQTMEVSEISYNDLFNLTCYVIRTEGFKIDDANRHSGEIESQWDFRKLIDVGRFPIRRKLFALIEPIGDKVYSLSVKIDQEALWKNYGSGVDVRMKKGWETYGHDKETTSKILTRIRLMVREFKPSDDFYQQYKRIDKIRDSLPPVLKPPDDKDS